MRRYVISASQVSGNPGRIVLQMLCNHRNSLSMSSVLDRISFSQQHGDFGFLMSPNAALDQNRNHVKARKIKSGHKYAYSVSEDAAAAFDSVGCKVARKSFYSADVTSASLFDSSLPLECKLRIFSYLRHEEKGKCMLVSKEWYDLIRLPDLWQNVDLREFKLCSGSHADDDLDMDRCADDGEEMPIGGPVIRYTQCTQNCYVRYMNRIDSFISFLIDVRPRVKRLVFSFDLISDNWLATINRLIMFANLDELEYANMNWRDTPVKPYWLDQPEPALNDLLYKTRRRQRYFLNFFELFVQRAPNVMSLVLPFEWSPRSIKYLISLKKLRNLTIEKYFVLQRLDQEGLNALSRIKCLQRLVLEVWNPSSHDMMKYKLTSKTLRYLDMSQCRGLYLSQVDLPALQVFITERRPWNGPMTFVTQMSRAPINCLRDIMLSGARHLVRINDTRLEGDDSLMVSEHMSELWKRICPCRQHKSSLTM